MRAMFHWVVVVKNDQDRLEKRMAHRLEPPWGRRAVDLGAVDLDGWGVDSDSYPYPDVVRVAGSH